MKKILLFVVCGVFASQTWAQAPVIDGDLLLCPQEEGTATIINDQEYDSYQWYFKYWFLPDDFQPIPGANEASFTYDWNTYDQAILKVVVTLDGETYTSNEIQIDSWNWVGLVLFHDTSDEVVFDPDSETFLLCEGGSFELSINNPPYDTNIVWYKDEAPISGADASVYVVTEPGFYYVSAAPSFCPNNSNNSMGIAVAWNPECNLSVSQPEVGNYAQVYPNPTQDEIILASKTMVFDRYQLVDIHGKIVVQGSVTSLEQRIALTALSHGLYFLKCMGPQKTLIIKVVKL